MRSVFLAVRKSESRKTWNVPTPHVQGISNLHEALLVPKISILRIPGNLSATLLEKIHISIILQGIGIIWLQLFYTEDPKENSGKKEINVLTTTPR